MAKRYFGTDGIRGYVGKHPITADFLVRLGWAAGKVLASEQRRKVLVGKDTRISGYMIEAALEAGLSSAGVDVHFTGPMPTPAIAYLARTLHADAGIVISASHNPYHDNGIKFFDHNGCKLADGVEEAIENLLDQPMQTVNTAHLGKAHRLDNGDGRYIEFCKSRCDRNLSLNHLRIVMDCAHGATYHVAPSVFQELGAQVNSIGVSPDGLNINAGYGSTSPERLCQEVRKQKADLGIAFDGDGDRLIMVDHQGEVVDGDELLFIIAGEYQRKGLLGHGVVGTQMTNLGLEKALEKQGLILHRSRVGDRYVMEALKQHQLVLGGEGSGHIICLDRVTTGDAIVAALQVLEAMVSTGKSLAQLKQGMVKYPQVMINVPLPFQGFAIDQYPAIAERQQQLTDQLAGRGRILLRPSGTEPLIRVMVEAEQSNLARQCAEQLAETVTEMAQQATR